MNLLEIRTETRRLMAETNPSASYASDADINKFINEGIKDMCIKAGVLERTKSATLLSGTASYLLSWDFLEDIAFLNPNKISLTRIDPSNLGGVYIIAGKPLYYYITQSITLYTTRVDSSAYTLTSLITLTTPNGHLYECTTAGTTASSQPTFTVVPGSTTIDGSVIWTCREFFTRQYAIVLYDTPTTAGGGTGTYTLIYKALDEGLYVDTDSPNFPLDKHHSLIPYACHRWAVQAKDLTLAAAFLTDYSAGLGLSTPGSSMPARGAQPT